MVKENARLQTLTLREKIGQTALMQGAFFMNMEDEEGYLKDNPIGQVWHNCNTYVLAANLADLPIDKPEDSTFYRTWARNHKKYLKVPPFIANDGPTKPMATDMPGLPGMTIVGANNSVEVAREMGRLYAKNAKTLGLQWVWVPCVDIPSRYSWVSIMRTFSDQKEKLVEMAQAMIEGAMEGNLALTAKHFPGTDRYEYRDNHFVNTFMRCSMDEWWAEQGWVFQKLIDGGVPSIMIGHNAFPAADNTKVGTTYIPATLSSKIIQDLLKDQMGFDGVVITDSIDMAGLKTAYPDREDMLVALVNAGNDVLLNVKDLDYIDIIEKAVNDGRIPMSRIDDACNRILNLKERLGMFEETEDVPMTKELYDETMAFNRKVAENAITMECNLDNLLPLDASKIKNVAIICSSHSNGFCDGLKIMKKELEDRGMKVRLQRRLSSYEEMHEISEENDLIIYASMVGPHCPMGGQGLYGEECETFFYAFGEGMEKSVGVSMGSVYVYYDYFANMRTYVHAYNSSEETQKALVKALFGELPFNGTLPYIASWRDEVFEWEK